MKKKQFWSFTTGFQEFCIFSAVILCKCVKYILHQFYFNIVVEQNYPVAILRQMGVCYVSSIKTWVCLDIGESGHIVDQVT